MKVLAVETATEACSVAVWDDGRVLERFEIAPRRHAELALPWADAVLAEAGIARRQLDAIAVSRGPGAFTGVRLGIALAQGIALALDRPVVALSTLAVLAMRADAPSGAHVLAAIDARMGEVYSGAFRIGDAGPAPISSEGVGPPDALALARLGGEFAHIDAGALPHAGDLAHLAAAAFARGAGVAPERIEPAYLRDNVALTLAEQQARRAR